MASGSRARIHRRSTKRFPETPGDSADDSATSSNLTTAYNRVVALEAESGKELWLSIRNRLDGPVPERNGASSIVE